MIVEDARIYWLAGRLHLNGRGALLRRKEDLHRRVRHAFVAVRDTQKRHYYSGPVKY